MDLFEQIIADHRLVAKLMDELLDINLAAVQAGLFSQIRAELLRHAAAEEATLYRALRGISTEANAISLIGEAVADHDEMRTLMDVLTREGIAGPGWMEQFGEFRHAVTHHVRQEEEILLPQARRTLSDEQLSQLGAEFMRLKSTTIIEETPAAATLHP